MSSDSSSAEREYEKRKIRKKRRHRSTSPEHRVSDNRDSHSHRHKHIKQERDRHGIKIEPRDREHHREHRSHRSRSPIGRHGSRHHGDGVSHIKQEPQQPGYSRQQRGSDRDAESRKKYNRRREEHRQNPENENWGQTGEQGDPEGGENAPKDKPDFGLSGKLTEETNTYKGVVIKYNEPEEARKPRKKWRLYPFKGDDALPVMHIHRQSAFLFGRDRKIADLPVDHPSCSKQHAVLQYRLVDMKRPDGRMGRRIKPYIIDLGSANGTYVNNQRIDSQRYVELLEKDVIKFGFSSREYVLLHDNLKVSDASEED